MDMKKRTAVSLALVLLLCAFWVLPALAVEYATVYGGWLRLRSNPSYSAPVISSYRTGTVVTVLNREIGWTRVMTPDYRIGYMDSRYLRGGSAPLPTVQPTPQPYSRTWTQVNRTAYVTSQNGRDVRMRSAPEVNQANVLGLYPVGRTVTELRVSNDGWSYIKIDRKHGYMMSKFLTTHTNPVYPPAPTAVPWTPYVTPVPYPIVTGVPNATYIPLPTATPQPSAITQVKLDPAKPRVGDTLRVIVVPENAQYTVTWYRQEDNVWLSSNTTYKVSEGDLDKHIMAHVQGYGASAGFTADAPTAAVQAQPSP